MIPSARGRIVGLMGLVISLSHFEGYTGRSEEMFVEEFYYIRHLLDQKINMFVGFFSSCLRKGSGSVAVEHK